MSDFPRLWMTDICTELNKAGLEMPKEKGGGKWDIAKFQNSIEFMKEYVTLDSGIYEYINSKGLMNRGQCPITGEKIGTAYLYQILGRKVYISERGQEMAKEWDRQEHIRVFGKEPMSQEQKEIAYENFKKERPKMPIVYWLFIIVGIIYLIKKCS